jgi:phosphoglycerate dehydrogenase-like enzyme
MAPRLLLGLGRDLLCRVFPPEILHSIRETCDVIDAPVPPKPTREFLSEYGRQAEIIVTGWGTPPVDAGVLAAGPRLKLVAHAAGSVKPVMSREAWQRGIRVTGASSAIAVGVAEFCVAMIIAASKRVFWLFQRAREGHWEASGELFGPIFELYRQRVGIIGASQVGRRLLALLLSMGCSILVYDPYWPRERIEALGALKAESIEEVFRECRVVSLNAPSTQETQGMIRGIHFALLREGSVFVNTSRGALIAQEEMVEQLRRGRFVACLDVTSPEPLPIDHPLRRLPNVILTPHQAGPVAENLVRIGAFITEELQRYVSGEALRGEVTHDQLDTIA